MWIVTVAIERHYSFVDHIELVFGNIMVTEDLVAVVVIVHQVVDLVRRLLGAHPRLVVSPVVGIVANYVEVSIAVVTAVAKDRIGRAGALGRQVRHSRIGCQVRLLRGVRHPGRVCHLVYVSLAVRISARRMDCCRMLCYRNLLLVYEIFWIINFC